jgi:hypothetical protein
LGNSIEMEERLATMLTHVRRYSRVLCVATAGIAAGCGDGGGDPSRPADPALTVEGASVQAAGIMTVRVQGVTLSAPEYEGTLGGAPVVLATRDDSTLVALVPAVAAGPHTLSARIGGRDLTGAVNVTAARAIADPVAHVDATFDQLEAAFPVTAPPEIAQADWDTQRAQFVAAAVEARDHVAGLPPEQQLEAARFLAALTDELAPLAGAQQGMSASVQGASAECNVATAHLVLSTAALLTSGVAIAVGIVGNPWLLPVGAGLLAYTMPEMRKDIARVYEHCDKQRVVSILARVSGESPTYGLAQVNGGSAPFGLSGASGQASAGAGMRMGVVSFTPASGGVATEASASQSAAARIGFVRERPVRTTPTQGIQAFSTSHIPTNSSFTRISNALDKVAAKFAELPEWARSMLPVIPRISTVGEKPIVTTTLGPDSIRIANVTGGVTLRSTVSGDALVLTADASGSGEREFTFDVISTTDPSVRSTIQAILRPESPVTLMPLAEWFTGAWSSNEQNQTVTLRCRMEWRVTITGTEPVHLSSMSWLMESVSDEFPDVQGSESYPHNSYAPGELTLWGEWWWTWPMFSNTADFTVYMQMGYTTNVSGESGSTNPIEMVCRAPTG